jgi:hypothetical protein
MTKTNVIALGLLAALTSACGTAGDDATTTTSTAIPTQGQAYTYVLVVDNEVPAGPAGYEGADIDAIQLVTATGTFDAAQVVEVTFGVGDNINAADASSVLGAPGSCSDDSPLYVSLGGEGGYLIVSFTGLQEVHAGDTIRVSECGTASDYSVYVGVATSQSDPNWFALVTNASSDTDALVPTLPVIPGN